MSKYEIIVNEIHEDGTRTPLLDTNGQPFTNECLGFCLMEKVGEDETGIQSQIGFHMVSGMDLIMMTRDCDTLRKVAHEVTMQCAMRNLIAHLGDSKEVEPDAAE